MHSLCSDTFSVPCIVHCTLHTTATFSVPCIVHCTPQPHLVYRVLYTPHHSHI